MKGEKLEKTLLEKILGFMPNYGLNKEKPAYFDLSEFVDSFERDVPQVYDLLRTTEQGYEQLDKLGFDVKDKLKEKRFQIAEFVLDMLIFDLEGYKSSINDRDDHSGLGNFSEIVPGAKKLIEYLKKLYLQDECYDGTKFYQDDEIKSTFAIDATLIQD